MKTVLKILIAVVSVLCAIAIFQAMSLTSRQISRPPRDDAPVLASQGNIFAEHLAQAIRIKTVSFDDPALVDTKAIQGQFFLFFFFFTSSLFTSISFIFAAAATTTPTTTNI